MPMLDHFHGSLGARRTWERVHGGWPMVIVQALYKVLPPRYSVGPTVTLGQLFEIDIGTMDRAEGFPDSIFDSDESPDSGGGGTATLTATAVATIPAATQTIDLDWMDQDTYEVEVFDTEEGRVVAAIEIVSPGNKDRPESRQAFVSKCSALLQNRIAVSIVDLVTVKQFNLYAELIAELGGKADAAVAGEATYAASLLRRGRQKRGKLLSWAYPMKVDQPMPAIPIWLNEREAVMLDLDATYEETCRVLRFR
jgi:hypothetical protein